MNIFKREVKLFLRNRLFQLLLPLSVLSFSLWITVGLKTFESNNLDIVAFYNIVPIIFALIIPLLSYTFWQRERKTGLDGILLNTNLSAYQIILFKFLSLITIFSIILLLFIPVILLVGGIGFFDKGQLFSINIGLFLFIILAVSFSMMLSVIIKSRILNIIVGILLLVLAGYGNQKLMTFFNGRLSISNLLYSIFLSVLFLVITRTLIVKKLHSVHISCAICLVFLSLFIPGSLDLTTLKSYTLSDYSRSYIEEINDEIVIEYYYSNNLSTMSSLPGEIKYLLKQFDKIDNLDLDIFDDSQSEFSESVRKYQPGSLENGEIYNFIVIKYKDYFKVIPFIPYVETLEFEIVKVLHYFVNNGLKSVGIYIGNEDFTQDNFTALNTALSQDFETFFLFPGDVIPDDLDTLFVIGHYGINYTYIGEIGHYLAHGGNLIVAGSGLSTGDDLAYKSTPMLESLAACGVIVEPYLLGVQGTTSDYDLNIITYPNRALIENSIILPFTGFIGIYTSPVFIKNSDFINLLYSSKEAWLVDSSTGLGGIPEGEFPVSIYGEGHFSESFSGERTDVTNKLLVVGSSFSFTDYIVGIGGDNSFDFITRALYSMVGYDDLMSIRHKFNWETTFIKIERDIYKESLLFTIKLLILFVYPLLILLITSVIRKKLY